MTRPADGATAAPTGPNFTTSLDFNAGIGNLRRKKPDGTKVPGWFPTTNLTAKLFYHPLVLMGKHAGLLFQLGAWVRTWDAAEPYSKSVLRFFLGPVAYVRPIETTEHRLQALASFNYFFGTDLDDEASSYWLSNEGGFYWQVAYTYKPAHLTIDAHGWCVIGDIDLTKGISADENGVIVGSTLSWKPFTWTGVPLIENLAIYARFREWGWAVTPEGADASKTWWEEITAGVTADYRF